ncbi:hypothetical protein Tco_0967057 [Tanacetum coccineum]
MLLEDPATSDTNDTLAIPKQMIGGCDVHTNQGLRSIIERQNREEEGGKHSGEEKRIKREGKGKEKGLTGGKKGVEIKGRKAKKGDKKKRGEEMEFKLLDDKLNLEELMGI